MNKKLVDVVKRAMSKKAETKTLDSSERDALSEILGFITKSIGDDEDIEKFQVVRDSLSQTELNQLEEIEVYVFEDENDIPKVTKKLLEKDIPLLKKVYKIIEDNNLLDGNWDAMSGFEKICL